MQPVDTIEGTYLTVEIYPDLDAPNPAEEFDNWSRDDVYAWEDGRVYGYVITDPDGEHVDSCWGFYGWLAVEEAAREALEYEERFGKRVNEFKAENLRAFLDGEKTAAQYLYSADGFHD